VTVQSEPGEAVVEERADEFRLDLPSILSYWADATPYADFLTFQGLDGGPTSWTYGQFRAAVAHLAELLRDSGLRPGDRCVVHTGNSRGFMSLFWAVQEVGAVIVPTIAQYSADELGFVIEDCNASVVIATPDLADTALEAIGDSGRILLVEGGVDADGRLALEHRQGDPLAGGRGGDLPEEVALVLYTSGTTSRPKGVMLSHSGLLYTARTYAEHFRLQAGDRTLTCLPLFHANGLLLQMIPVALSGGSIVVTPRFSASQYWDWVDRFDVTVTHLVAGPIRLLRGGAAEPDTSRVRLMSHGMPLTTDEIRGFEERFGIPLIMVWGSTETGCGGTLMPLDAERRPGHQNIGKAMPGWQVAVTDPDTGTDLPAGDLGELWVKSPGVMVGYLGRPETTEETLVDGWVRTGDLGWVDEAGYFHFVDRLKDMLKPSGENVAASEVERVIIDHPSVHKCAVVGLPDEVRMETVVAVVVPEEGADPTADEIRAHCGEHLASFKVPSRVEFRRELPETSIGKTRKAELKQELLAMTGKDQ
jgi:crotonobetaine/carnitine-CoA ligase